jgi:FixJ family two-component response regulator
MPEMDGLSMYHHLRDIGVNTTIIFTSGYADELLSEELTDGNFDFLTKPFANKALIEMVKTHLASSGSQ